MFIDTSIFNMVSSSKANGYSGYRRHNIFKLFSNFIILYLFSVKSVTLYSINECEWCKQCITIKKLTTKKLGQPTST